MIIFKKDYSFYVDRKTFVFEKLVSLKKKSYLCKNFKIIM